MAAVRLPRERFDYSPMATRRQWTLPRGARIAVWTIVNVEEWDIEQPMARHYLPAPQGVSTLPDVPSWAWHDYGMRVGVWRLLEAFADFPVIIAADAVDSMDGEEMHRFALRLMTAAIGWPLFNEDIPRPSAPDPCTLGTFASDGGAPAPRRPAAHTT